MRPDITYAVPLISEFMQQPIEIHRRAALRILIYIKSAPNKDLFYRRHRHLRVHVYSDFDYACDRLNMRSTTGLCTYVGGTLVTWRSKKQRVVSHSNTDVKYRVMA